MWYYATDDEKQGPVSEEEVTELVKKGHLDGNDLVWTAGMDGWRKVTEVEEISPNPPPIQGEEPPDLPSSPGSNGPSNRSEATKSGGSTQPDILDKQNEKASPNDRGSKPESDYAGFGKRLAAYAIDNALIFAVVFGASVVLILLGESETVDLEAFGRGLGLFGGWLYFAIFESSQKQATFGKQIMGLRVVDMNRGKIGFGKASGRYFGKIISGAIFLIGFFMAAFTEKSQALHDIMSNCLVVKNKG